MTWRRGRTRRRAGGFAAPLIAAVLAVGASAALPRGAAALTPSPALKRAVVVVSPALVHVVVDVTGSLLDADGSVHGPLHDTLSGTGWFVDNQGDLVTAGHVAAPSADELDTTIVRRYIQQTYCPSVADCEAEIGRRLSSVTSSARVTGVHVGVRVLTQDVTLPEGASAADAYAAARPARLLESSPAAEQDLAVLHVDAPPVPVALVASRPSAKGTAVALLGFPAAHTFTVPPTFGYGSVLNTFSGAEIPQSGLAQRATVVDLDAYAEQGFSGGPGVDESGQVVGLVSFGPANPDSVLHQAFLISAADITAMLARAGVSNRLGPVDTAWRSGLAAHDRGEDAAAATDFTTCLAASPIHVGCRSSLAALRSGSSASGSGGTSTLVLAVVVGTVAALVAVGLVLWRRWRARQRRERDRRALFRA